jgi:hypothetical protein
VALSCPGSLLPPSDSGSTGNGRVAELGEWDWGGKSVSIGLGSPGP